MLENKNNIRRNLFEKIRKNQELSEEEKDMVFKEFAIIDANINKINEIPNIKDVLPMTHALDNFEYVLRDDEVEESIDIKDLLANCDDTDGDEVSVPKAVG